MPPEMETGTEDPATGSIRTRGADVPPGSDTSGEVGEGLKYISESEGMERSAEFEAAAFVAGNDHQEGPERDRAAEPALSLGSELARNPLQENSSPFEGGTISGNETRAISKKDPSQPRPPSPPRLKDPPGYAATNARRAPDPPREYTGPRPQVEGNASLAGLRNHDGNPIEKHAGKWTDEEQTQFLEGLERHGRDATAWNKRGARVWNDIASLIRTRTAKQVQGHAQSYFEKLEREALREGRGDVASFYEVEDVTFQEGAEEPPLAADSAACENGDLDEDSIVDKRSRPPAGFYNVDWGLLDDLNSTIKEGGAVQAAADKVLRSSAEERGVAGEEEGGNWGQSLWGRVFRSSSSYLPPSPQTKTDDGLEQR